MTERQAGWWEGRSLKVGDRAGAVAELLRRDADRVENRHPQVRDRRSVAVALVQAALHVAGDATDHERRQVELEMQVAVAHARSVYEQRVIEDRSVTVRRVAQLVEEVGELL